MATIRIPPVLRPSVGGEREVSADGSNVGEVLRSLVDAHSETQDQIFGADGDLNRYVNVYLNDEDVRVLDGLDTPWRAGNAWRASRRAWRRPRPLTCEARYGPAGSLPGTTIRAPSVTRVAAVRAARAGRARRSPRARPR